MLIGIKFLCHLLIWVNVVPEIPQSMAELFYILCQQAQIAGDIDEITQRPFVKLVYFSSFRACEVEHLIPWSLGGTDHLNNLYPACIPCNRGKGTTSTRTVRAWNGRITSAAVSRA
jgi:HNH endonuclease